jgi:hypothetical protein
MVGLAIDGGLGYLESTRMQRAADAAALAGVIWLPDNRQVGDARAQLAAEANGIKVACYYNTGLADTDPYNQRCRRTSYTKVTQNGPDQYYSFDSDVPPGIAIRYKVTLSKMQTRFFLGVLGFPSYPIVRTSTAEYFHRVKFGSSFNYYGSNGVLNDHYMRCDDASLGDCAGPTDNSLLDMRGATYQKYIIMRCEQPNPPSPCIGGFWGHMGGQDILHTNGDAYNPIRDGGGPLGSGPGVNGKSISDNGSLSTDCLHTSDPTTWFVTNIFSAPNSNCTPYDSTTIPPIINGDIHPDAPNGQHGFGSEVIVDVDQAAIWSYEETQANVANHTNLNVTIYDGAENEQGGETFGTADNYQTRGGNYGDTPPYTGWDFQNITSPADLSSSSAWETKRLVCSPGTTSLPTYPSPGYCDSATLGSPSNPTDPRAVSTTSNPAGPDQSNPAAPGDIATFFPDRNNLELTYNDLRTRLTLYGPPPTPAIPSIYANVQAYKVGSFEITDMSIRKGSYPGFQGVQAPIGCPAYNPTANFYDVNYGDPVKVANGTSKGSDDNCPLPSRGTWDTKIITGTTSSPPVKPYFYYEYQRYCYFIFDDSKSFWDNTKLTGVDTDSRVKSPPSTGNTNAGPDYAYNVTSPANRYAYVCPNNPASPYYAADPSKNKNYPADPIITGMDVRWNQLQGTPTARYGGMVDFDLNNPGDRTIQQQILDTTGTPTTPAYSPVVTGTLIYTTTNPSASSTGVTLTVTGVTLNQRLADPEAQSTITKTINI